MNEELTPIQEEALASMQAILEKYECLAGFQKITATLTRDVHMRVWNGKHPVDNNTTTHVAPAGTKVLIWMHSRFGDFGITDNLINPRGYDARVELDALVNIQDEGPMPRESMEY